MKRCDIHKILVIGSGPIVIGQAAEFDYAGTQACLALKAEGYEVVLCNSNPATIMTDNLIADKIYMEPLDLEFISKIIRKERPDAIIGTLGGQTGLNLAVQLAKKGVLEECNVEVLGTSFTSIEEGEDRDLFKKLCQRIKQPVLDSYIAHSVEEAIKYANIIGYEIIVRPAYTLGGTGGGFASCDEELMPLAENALKLSPVGQLLIEKSIKGYKEIEFEVIRDAVDNAIIVCSMENIDPVGVHTGDSMVVAPCQTLAPKEYQMLRNAAIDIVRELKIKGGCNVQFALDPESFDYYVIEVNPRVSRSSALASKASGYPIARVSSLIAVGYNLDEIKIAETSAAAEPTLDYVVLKLARFYFDKFKDADRKLSTQMKATGEVMAIARTFEECFLKAIRSLEIGVNHIYLKKFDSFSTEQLLENVKTPTDERIFAIAELLRRNVSSSDINKITKIDCFFLNKFNKVVKAEQNIVPNMSKEEMLKTKKLGFSDAFIAKKIGKSEIDVFKFRQENGILPSYKIIDSCGGEFKAYIPYFYSSYEKQNESRLSEKQKVVVLGSGPIRIGQGVEFDYSTVHAIWAIKEAGYEAIVINNNPETVSTDYLVTDKLYFEGLTIEDVMNIIAFEKPMGVIATLGGQTAINLAQRLTNLNVKIIGTDFASIARAEDREQFEQLLSDLNILRPKGFTVHNEKDGLRVAKELTYPVLVRPSYVLGGRAMVIVYSDEALIKYLTNAFSVDDSQPVLIDKYIVGREVEVDAICDGKDVFIPGIMEHIEGTGVHSGDSISVYPSITLCSEVKEKIKDITIRLGLAIGIVGLYNIQFIVTKEKEVYIIEVNPRSSRTVPFLSKVTKTNMAKIATKTMLGYSLKDQGITKIILDEPNMFYVKAPTFSFSKIRGLDVVLSPEMKSTGEAIGYDKSLNRALYKALKASNLRVVNYGTVFVTLSDGTKDTALPLVRRFYNLGFNIEATEGTGKYLKEQGIRTRIKRKISQGSDEILTSLKKGHIAYLINTISSSEHTRMDGFMLRRVASENNVTTFTSLDTVKVLLDVLEEITMSVDLI